MKVQQEWCRLGLFHLIFCFPYAAQVGNTRKPVPSGGSGMTIAQEAARNVDPATGPKTAEEEEKQRKRLEAWKKIQEKDKEKETDKDKGQTVQLLWVEL